MSNAPHLPMLLLGLAIVWGSGFAAGWHWPRSTRYMLGGRL
jgi:hypothetical protein